MSPERLARYVARLRAESAGLDWLHVDVPYMVGRKRHDGGKRWSNAAALVYRAQRLARVGYSDAAHGRPVRNMRAEPVTVTT
ncbi:hypothetical protein D9M68_800650 [compost metagenome]